MRTRFICVEILASRALYFKNGQTAKDKEWVSVTGMYIITGCSAHSLERQVSLFLR